MGPESRTGAVITAAGRSSRMGMFKPLLKIGSITAVERVVSTYQAAGINDIVVVTGNNAEELENSLKHFGVVFLRNDMYKDNEMFDSVKIGLDYLKEKCDKVFISPVDVPLFTTDTIKALLKSKRNVGIPAYKEKTGHPIILDNNAVARILTYNGSSGLRGAITNLSLEIEYIETTDPGTVYDMDTQADYADILKLYSERTGESKE